MEILLPILLGLLLGAGAAAVVAVMMVRNEKQQNQLLQNNIHALREEKDMLTRSEATIAAHLTNAEQTIANIKEQHQQEKENGHDIYCENATGAMLYWVIGGFCVAGAIMYAIPATILTISSHRNLNAAVDGYNQRSSDVTLNFGATNNGIGLTLNF